MRAIPKEIPSVPSDPPRGPQLRMWSQLRGLLADRLGLTGALAVGSVLSGLTEAGILAILAQTAVALVDGASRVRIDIGPVHSDETVGALLALALALALVRLALQGLVSVLPARIAADMQARLRTDLFTAFTCASWAVQSRDREGHLQETMTNQVAQAAAGTLQAATLVTSLLTFLVLVISALVLNVAAAFVVLAAAAALFALLRPLSTLGSQRAQSLSRAYIDYARGVSEATRIAEETHVFGADTAQRNRTDRLLGGVRDLFFQTQMLMRLVPGVYQSLIYLLVVATLIGLHATGTGQVASLGAVVLLLVRAGTYGQQAQGAYQGVRQAVPYMEHLQEVKQHYVASRQPKGTQFLEKVWELAFTNVSFAYEPGRPVLSNITFGVASGEAIGIVGPSGAGKSTLVQILLRLRAPDSGCYLVNGDPAEQFTREEWHRRVAYVPQEPRLLHASVAENIRFFRSLDDGAVQRAACLAGIHDDIMKWPEGYETLVGPRADAVSGGQQQRICLARALAAEPQVLVLDEPTSALDPHSERLIHESLATLKHQLTLFIVAHRMTTLDMCERVMVIVDGRLEAFDTASELRDNSVYYRSASAIAVQASTGSES